uniref:NIDO domain-containing protein n=1 Tax=Acrobeloides nanus TaxID=290746 RepID=A0A914E9J2_9BILA
MVIPNKFENFAYFGTNYSTLWVNTNGAFSFRTAISTFTPSCSPLNATYSMVAPYWADVDISMTGHIYYRQTQNSTILAKAKNEINNAFPQLPNINLNWAFIATWYNVTYYPDNLPDYYYRKRDIFQATLVSNGAHSFAIFYYNQILWTTGDASGGNNGLGGTPAFAGFDAGDGQDRYTIPGSCTADIINIVNETNCGKSGVFVFRIDNSTIIQPLTSTTVPITTAPTTTTQITSTLRSTTTSAPSAPSTTQGSTSPLSNSDGTPCNCNNSGLWLDLMLVIDRSAGVGSDGLSAIGGQLLAILDSVPVAQSGQGDFYTRVGLVVYSGDVQVVGNLTHYQSFNDLMMDLINLSQYYKANDRIADIGKALQTTKTIFDAQSTNQQRNARKAVILYASSYNKINDDPVTIAAQMNNSNTFIITVDYHDKSGVATKLLSQISTPFMNFSSTDAGEVVEVKTALCYANCACPSQTVQLKTYDPTTKRQTYYSDCFYGVASGTYYKYAELVCESKKGTLASLTTPIKNYFLLRSAGDGVYLDKLNPSTWAWMTEGATSNSFPYMCQIRACDSTPRDCDRSGWLNIQKKRKVSNLN